MQEENPTEYYPKQKKWIKAIFVLVVLVGYSFSEALLWCLSIFQFGWVVIKGETNQYVEDFGETLVTWNRAAILFCLWKKDQPPFPFSKWPD
jgi:hypothetical protein